jgi:type II secretory ATPase GspE/PulE/Tfp pilus assembly ATPase PilB-like protein
MNAAVETETKRISPAPKLIRSLADLPPDLERCLSDGEIRIGDAARREIVLLDSGLQRAVLILADRLSPQGSNSVRDLKTRAIEKGYRLVAEYRADAGLIPLIYQRFSTATAVAAIEVSSEAQRRFDELVYRAGQEGASDIHVILRGDHADIRIRVHGELETVAQWTAGQTAEMCACAYNVLAGIRDVTWDPSRRQDANIERSIDGRPYRLRYAHGPLYPNGVHVVLRLLSTGRGFQFAPSLQTLGYSDGQAAAIEAMVAEPSGIVVISGETGSGKSTTLANLMHLLLHNAGGGLAILTVEDPPEYEVPGVLQTPVVHSRDDRERGASPYVDAIRSAMRRDPDLLMIGEIRDLDTAVLAAQSAQSGHPVLTTVHASRALDIVGRLEGMGATMANNPINRALLCAPRFISGLIHQVLVPLVCETCGVPFAEAVATGGIEPGLATRVKAVLNDASGVRVRGPGCEHCRGGIKGRSVCAEAIAPDAALRQLLLDRRDQAAFDYWVGEGGGYSIWAHALDKLSAGLVAPADVEACLGRLRREGGAP